MERAKRYSDYFYIPREYKPNMDRDTINDAPDRWLHFYPHKKYVSFLRQLLDTLNGGDKSIWLSGNYGTGKSYAALVTQKLFMDDEKLVKQWFAQRESVIDSCDAVEKELFLRRKEGTLVVYDYNALGVDANEEFLVRLERTIVSALKEERYFIPAKANIDEIIERITDDGENFIRTLDKIRGELAYLRDYKSIKQIVDDLKKPITAVETHSGLLADVQQVLHARSIFLALTVERFKSWIQEILITNNLKRIIYIFDEFSPFLEKHKGDLKTFEEVTEKGLGKFFFIPVTHLSIKSFWGEGSETAKRARDRFYFSELQMPTDTAFQLAADAMKPIAENAEEWKQERSALWSAISTFADNWFDAEDVSRQSLYDIIPIHPMAAFLLKFLSTSTGSNQRSIFEYLKGGANGQEFQEFMRAGGPSVSGKQFLTVDYLWRYFVERDDLGQNKEVLSTRTEFSRIKNREFQNRSDEDEEIRVLKAVLLFCLLNRLNPDGHERLKPTIQNIELSFLGDGSIFNVNQIIRSLAEKHCFSIVQGNIEPFYSSVGNKELEDEKIKLESKFHELLSDDIKTLLEKHSVNYRGGFSKRFDIRVSDAAHVGATYFQEAQRKKYSADDSNILLWFVVAKDSQEQLAIVEKTASFLEQFREHRIVCITFPEITFCQDNIEAWEEFISQYAQYNLELDSAAKKQRQINIDKMKKNWFDQLINGQTKMKILTSSVNVVPIASTTIVWAQFKNALTDIVSKTLPHCPDLLAKQAMLFSDTGLKNWALAGITYETNMGQIRPIIAAWSNDGILNDADWFAKNPTHMLTNMHDLVAKRISNTIARGSPMSIRKLYIDLQRAPYGMRYNALSAFVLGFVLKDMLAKKYQWTNGQRTDTLTVETLSEIIEDVVKDDGKNSIRAEKEICKLSKEEKAFVEKAPKMFGVFSSDSSDGTVETALLQIANKITAISSRVPLWMLPIYIESCNDPQSECLGAIIKYICTALGNSSKNADERIAATKQVGEILLSVEGIVECLADYIKPECFSAAFALYVNKSTPKLKKLAESLGDMSGAYLDSVKGKCAETAGWLFKEADITVSIDSTFEEYEAIQELVALSGMTSFHPFSDHIAFLKTAITMSNKLPKSVIVNEYPALSLLLSQITNGTGWVGLPASIKTNIKEIARLFYDVTFKEVIRIICKFVPEATNIPQADFIALYKEIESNFSTSENIFISEIRAKIEGFAKNSISRKIKTEWERISGTVSPDDWAGSVWLPARFALSNCSNYSEILSAIARPYEFASTKLEELLEAISNIDAVIIDKAQKQFLAETIPEKYARFKISFASLIDFLKEKYGTQPNKWAKKPDIDEFICKQYQTAFAGQIIERIRKKQAEELKEKLCKLAKENPELGLLFWE